MLSCQGEVNEQRTCIKREQVRLARFERTSPSVAYKPGSKLEKTLPRILKYQPTNARKDGAKSLGIDTGKDEQQLIDANPISRAVLLKAGFTSDQSSKEVLGSDD